MASKTKAKTSSDVFKKRCRSAKFCNVSVGLNHCKYFLVGS